MKKNQLLKHFPSLIDQNSYGGQHNVGIYFMVIYKCGVKVGSKKSNEMQVFIVRFPMGCKWTPCKGILNKLCLSLEIY